MPGDALDVFISYSHEDTTLRQELEELLVRLGHEGVVRAWHERQITAGEEWRGWTSGHLMSADLILLVVSAPFLASAYCRDAEVKYALERRALGDAEVIPIIARPCDWRDAPFAGLPTLPQGVGPVTEWHRRDSAWEDVAQGIREIAIRLRTAREAVPRPKREGARRTDRPAAAPPAAAARMPRSALLGVAAVLTLLAAVWAFVVWRPHRSEHGAARTPTAEVKPRLDPPEQASPAEGERRPAAAAAIEQPALAPAAMAPAEPDVAAAPLQAPPEPGATAGSEAALPPADTTSEQLAGVAGTEEARAPATAAAGTEAAPPEPGVELGSTENIERSLGILAVPGAESEADCVAVLVADAYALTSRACAQASAVVVMGGNALTATRGEIFDLEPRQPRQAAEVNIVKLIRGPGATYGFAAARLDDRFDDEALDAFYVESSAIRRGECGAQAQLAALGDGERAYVDHARLDRYVRFVEEAADTAISMAGSRWSALLPAALGSGAESLAGFVCRFPGSAPRDVVFSVAGSVVGIGYSCAPFDRLVPEVRDSLPPEIRQMDLDCIAPLGEIEADLRQAGVRIRFSESPD